ncbi:hypothetical protein GCM10023191_073950 [Actinoallomurus oryzae]|uniref:Uncharacterized protein n=1 Tax=Actinoallomurus oryzae TaxID=502180 RepID=A0ABP8QUY5_9ACTN
MISREGLAGWVPAGSLARRFKRGGSMVADDAECFEQARRIQESHRDWLVMWSPWHRTFTAFSCFTPDALVVDEPTPEALVNAMLRVELHYSPTRIDTLSSFSPPSPDQQQRSNVR